MVALTVFGFGLAEIIVVFAGLAYFVSLVRDWRPMRTLRDENRGLREDLDNAAKRIAHLEAEVERLSGITDLSVLQREHTAFAQLMQQLVAEVKSLDQSVRTNTAAVELIAKKDAIHDALSERRT